MGRARQRVRPRRPGTTVVVGGPDIPRRAEVARAIADAVGGEVVTFHTAGRGGRALRPRGRIRSLGRVGIEVLRHRRLLARTSDDRPLVVEGSWFDLLVHPDASGTSPSTIGTATALAPFAPRADLLVVVDPAEQPHRRPDVHAVDWAPWAWNQYGRWLARRVVEEPATAGGTAAVAAAARAALGDTAEDTAPRWVRAPLSRSPRDTRATVGRSSGAALAMQVPTRPASRAALAVNRALIGRGLAMPVVPPIDGLDDLCREIGLSADGMATIAHPAKGRVTVALSRTGRLVAVLKIGAVGDVGLDREASALTRVRGSGRFILPRLLWTGAWDSRRVLAMSAIDHAGIPEVGMDQIADVCVALHGADCNGGPVVHGDLSPWNLLAPPAGLAIIDWEYAAFESRPMEDLTHYAVRFGAQHGYAPETVAAGLTAQGSPGWRYMEAIGEAPGTAAALARRHLERSPWPSHYADQMIAHLT